jgi:hypothetical protein
MLRWLLPPSCPQITIWTPRSSKRLLSRQRRNSPKLCAAPEQGFTLLGQGRLLGVVSPRLMTPQEQLTLTAKNHDLMQIPAALDPNVPMRAWAEDNLHPPPKEQHFVFLYMRGEAMMRRPTLQAFSRHFRQVFYDNQRVTMALTEAPNGVLR